MIMELMANRWVLYVVCTLLVFAEMFFAKKWYTTVTVKIKDAKVKTFTNLVLGVLTCVALAAVQMWALCDVFGGTFYWHFVVAAGLSSTGIYLAFEKVFGNATANKLGEMFRSLVSHSDIFDGEISPSGAVKVAERIKDVVDKIDEKEAEKEDKAIAEIVSRLDAFLEDGKITVEEKENADKFLKDYSADDLKGNPTYERYLQLLNQE